MVLLTPVVPSRQARATAVRAPLARSPQHAWLAQTSQRDVAPAADLLDRTDMRRNEARSVPSRTDPPPRPAIAFAVLAANRTGDSMRPPTTERIFSSGDLPLLSLPGADGLITCQWTHESLGAPGSWQDDGDTTAERRRAQVGFVLVEPAWLVRAAAEQVRSAGVDAIVLHAHPSPPGRSALALAFASHLRNVLRRPVAGLDPRLPTNVVTAGLRPDLAGLHDLVRVPHLVTITDGTGAVADTIVWEIMTGGQFDAWLDGAPPTRPARHRGAPAGSAAAAGPVSVGPAGPPPGRRVARDARRRSAHDPADPPLPPGRAPAGRGGLTGRRPPELTTAARNGAGRS